MRSARVLLGLVGLVFGASASSRASAQDIEGKFQLALSTDLLTYDSSTTTYEGDFEVTSSNVLWGIRESLVVELGYGITDMIVIGGIVQLGGSSQSVETDTVDVDGDDGGKVSSLNVVIGPKVDVLFSPDSTVRPFVSAAVAFASSSVDTEDQSVTSITGFQLAARLGLHYFATETLSLMPALAFAYTSGSGESEPDGVSQTFEFDTESIQVGLMFGLSGWL